jgi:hypothetical protein
MSRTALTGALGFSRQSAKDTAAVTNFLYMPCTSVSLEPQQNAQVLPPEIGGDYFPRGSYKASVMGNGNAGFLVRPRSLGNLLLMLTGQDTVLTSTPVAGANQHTFSPFLVGSGLDLPWYTLIKDESQLWAEQHTNGRLSSLQLTVAKSAIMTGQATLVSTTPQSFDPTTIGTKSFDNAPPFQTCLASLNLTQEGSGTNISSNSVKVERLGFNYNNNLSNDEFSVGSFSLSDITLQQRAVTVDIDFVVRDAAIYEAVYYNGGGLPSSWSPTIYRGNLSVLATSTANIPSTTTPYSCQFNFPGLDFLMFPTPLQGADLVRGTLSTQVTLGPSGSDRFNVVLINDIAAY